MLSDMNHARNSKAAEIVEEYTSSLRELTTNSKPHINMLTILAEDYIEYASAIVEAVEAHLQKVQSEVKLPVLYLIDSIIKNVNRTYVNLFAKNIVHTFCHVFEKVDENTRAKLWKLRQTWNDIFPIQQLFSLDVGVHNIDPAWPLSALPTNALQSKSIIHVNPKFLQQKVQQPPTGTHRQPEKNAAAIVDKQMREFHRKQKELRALQQTKWKLAYLQRQSQLGRALVHIKPELINPDGTLQKPIVTTVPCDVSKLEEKESQPSTADVAPSPSDQVKSSPQPLENGADSDNADKDEQQPQQEEQQEQQEEPNSPRGPELNTSDDVPSVIVSPARSVRETVDEALPHSDAEQSDKVELSETPKDNKSIDTEQTTPRSISTSDRASDSRPRSPSERSPSKGSSSRSSKPRSSSSSHDKVKSSWSKSSSPRKKSHKRSRSPAEGGRHHRHRHRRRHHRRSPGLDEEEQFGGSLIVSPPQPNPVRQRKDSNASRRLKGSSSSRSRSPESGREEPPPKRRDSASSSGRDEDLRAELLAATKLETKEDLDLRVLPITATNKRPATDFLEGPDAKKSKEEQEFDDLFGKEDVDLRLLQNPPAAAKPLITKLPTPPPPCISSSSAKDSGKDSDKDCWARLKMPTASPRSLDPNCRPTSNERRRGQLRPRVQPQQQCRGRDYNNDRNSDRNIEIIMKQAAEQLNQGTITKSQYNKLIQEVLHMSEDQKLRAAQRKEREAKVWERHDGVVRPKEHAMHPRPPGPRWQQPWHQPWAHPPGPFQTHFRPDFRAIGPWQTQPRLFGPMRPPDFHQFHGGFNPRIGPPPIGPNGPLILPNGPALNPVPMGLVLQNPLAKRMPPAAGSGDAAESWSPGSPTSFAAAVEGKSAEAQQQVSSSSDEIPAADPELLEEIAKDSMRSINIDNVPREIRYYGLTGVIFMHWDDPRDIGFQNGARRIYIDGQESLVCSFNDDFRDFTHEGEVHRIKLGAPTRELYINDKWYPCYFGGQPILVDLGSKKVNIKLEGPPPQVKIGVVKRTDLVVGKINLIINARSMVPVFLDAKPQMFELEGMPCTLEFIDSLQTVLLNGRPLKVEFGGLPQPVLAQSKKHFIRFSVLPRGFRAGYVKIANMKGDQPLELPPSQPATASSAEADAKKEQTDQLLSTTATASPVEPDSTSQDGAEHSYASKSDLQLDVLSSVVPSAMAPSSGLSYQAEPVDNRSTTSAIRLPLNLNDLFQRLVETGIVSSLTEMKKPEEEEKNEAEIVPVTFNKSETLKIKNPAMVKGLYSGIQCSSCGMRFAPEMATHYSRHLDWHFRQNRKERDSSRKAHSRIWYYDINDWIQFEEIEDLEDRAQSWFETEKQNMETESAAAEELFVETLQPSVPTGIEEDSCCQVCHEIFEQFYNDEKEEWHLRPAVSFEDKNFHPLCLEDHKRALEESTVALEASELNESKIYDNIQNENQELKKDLEENVAPNTESMEEDIVTETINESEIISTEIEETISTEIEETIESKTEVIVHTDVSSELSTDETKNKETILETSEKLMEISEDISENVNVETEVQNALVETKESVASIETELESEDSAAQSGAIDSTQVAVKSTIDGNVDLESTTSTVVTVQSKIKINITKCLNSPKESKEIKDVKEEEEVLEENSEPLKPASIKPAIRDKNLSVLPPIQRGEELSGLCTIS